MTYHLSSKKEVQALKKKLSDFNTISKDRFQKYVGKVNSFQKIDSLDYQKKLRNEW